jgi:hypothetical protein
MDTQLGGQVSRAPTKEEELVRLLPLIKSFRVEVDALIQKLPHAMYNASPESIQTGIFLPLFNEAQGEVRVSLINAKMWAGKMLEVLGNPFPKELADKAE